VKRRYQGVMSACNSAVPAVPDNDAVSPFTTPGTRLTWSTLEEWTAAAEDVLSRPCSAKTYRDKANHLQELARHLHFVEAHERAELVALRAFLEAWYQPPRGHRAGTCYELLVNVIHNQLARLQREDQRAIATRMRRYWTDVATRQLSLF